jgi:alkanesulfonate monooxygenase SsuD/methylene tetrahydromethanopterin reductase-like flavin-dependent oxidoreductase (luciferase family)
MAAEYAAVWNAAGGTPTEVAEASAVLNQHCADVGRDPATIRRSVQIRVGDDFDALQRTLEEFVAVGVSDPLLIVQTDDPVRRAESLAEALPRLRESGEPKTRATGEQGSGGGVGSGAGARWWPAWLSGGCRAPGGGWWWLLGGGSPG